MGLFGKVIHYSFDAVLLSAIVAGVRRSSGLTLRSNSVDDPNAKHYLRVYLGVGEWMLDTSATLMSASGYFERRLP